jgi:Zn-finger nucleic acid-binding protein
VNVLGIDPLTDLAIVASVFVVAWTFVSFSVHHKRSPVLPGNPLLLAYYTYGRKVISAHEGTTEHGIHYTAFVTSNQPLISGSTAAIGTKTSLIYRVELPYQSQIHLLGIPNNPHAAKLEPITGPNKMEQVDLEGDFGNYFSLYADRGKQAQARYLLDPKTMAFIVDFCSSHSWEIINDEFYFVQTAQETVAADATTMFDNIQRFADEIRPVIAVPAEKKLNVHKLPYNRTRERDIYCPICNAQLEAQRHYYACPNQHGKLISGGQLLALRDDLPDDVKLMSEKHAVEHREVNCPNCKTQMTPTPYNGRVTIIDVCTNCPYRWIDAGELASIIL